MQLSLFNGVKPFKIDKPIRLIELFGGISCQAQALLNLGVDFEEYRYCDFDKYACQSHNEIMGTNDKPSDITKWKGEDLGICDIDKYCYIMTYSYPCTDLSTAGKMAGMERGSGTRSGLLWEVERLLKECNEVPQVLLMENVPQVHGKKNKASFDEWCQSLENLGYKNYWKDLNSKDYGVPQSRNRCFMVSLFGDYSYEFPEPIELKLKLQDLLEDEVDEKYYISDKIANTICNLARNQINDNWIADKEIKLNQIAEIPKEILNDNERQRRIYNTSGLAPTVLARQDSSKILCIGKLNIKAHDQIKRVYSIDGVCPTLDTMQGGNIQPKIMEKNFVNRKYKEFVYQNGYIPDKFNPYHKKQIDDIAPTLSTYCGSTTSSATILLKKEMCNTLNRIRKLTPTECLRLQGVRDEYSKRMTCSSSQRYKQAGNGIVVDVLMAIFKQML